MPTSPDVPPMRPVPAENYRRPTASHITSVVSIAVGIPVTVVILGAAALIGITGGFHVNEAKQDAAPLTERLKSQGAERVCDSGDAGYSPDNTQPWYRAEYRVPDDASARSALFDEARKQGFTLVVDKSATDDGVSQKSYTSDPTSTDRDDPSKPTLSLTVSLDSAATLDCASGPESDAAPPAAGSAVYDLGLTYPRGGGDSGP